MCLSMVNFCPGTTPPNIMNCASDTTCSSLGVTNAGFLKSCESSHIRTQEQHLGVKRQQTAQLTTRATARGEPIAWALLKKKIQPTTSIFWPHLIQAFKGSPSSSINYHLSSIIKHPSSIINHPSSAINHQSSIIDESVNQHRHLLFFFISSSMVIMHCYTRARIQCIQTPCTNLPEFPTTPHHYPLLRHLIRQRLWRCFRGGLSNHLLFHLQLLLFLFTLADHLFGHSFLGGLLEVMNRIGP